MLVKGKVRRFESYCSVRAVPSIEVVSAFATRNRSVTIDFDHRRSLLSDNGRFRPSLTDFGRYQSREKEEEGEEKGEPRDPTLFSRSRTVTRRLLDDLQGESLTIAGKRKRCVTPTSPRSFSPLREKKSPTSDRSHRQRNHPRATERAGEKSSARLQVSLFFSLFFFLPPEIDRYRPTMADDDRNQSLSIDFG
ncbi:hypothetical protein B296_00034030 [Ensete ventricosum]|uniref:Uncharacterized protein n=1 Tax=Ensete ventricosum TaxID=4639 RepID=A0A427A9H6_ENSVE|nr:hypothetical protein B296_00034030 [Ensete ventricosum]